MNNVILKDMEVTASQDEITVMCQVVSDCFPDTLWFTIKGVNPAEYKPAGLNWAIVAVLIPVMLHGKDVYIEGRVSKILLSHLRMDLQSILGIYDPKLKKIDISARETEETPPPRSPRVGTGFSAGIDSFATLSLYSGDNAAGLRVTDLCTFNVGAMGEVRTQGVVELFQRYSARTEDYARQHSLNAISVDSNVSEFYHGSPFQYAHTFRNAAAALCLEGILGYYLYSSAYDLYEIKVSAGSSIGHMDPIILPMLSTESFSFISAGAGYNRFEKTAQVGDYTPSYDLLDVCIQPAKKRMAQAQPNCSQCWKCRRTMVSLDALGLLDKYSNVFDIAYFKANKSQMIDAMTLSAFRGDKLDLEVIKNIGEEKRRFKPRIFYKITRTKTKNALKALLGRS